MPKTVLVVDDSASLRQIVCIALNGAGYEVVEARDGKDALEKIDTRRIHLVISDVNMPNMDGIAFVKELKQRPECRYMPVIMLTTENQEKTIREGWIAGVKAWVVKPFHSAQIVSAVAKFITP